MRDMRPIVTALVAVAAWAVCGPAWGTSFTRDLRNRRAGGTRPRLAAAAQEADGALRSFALGAGVADVGEVAVGDALTVTLFDDVTVSLVLKEKMPSPLGGDVFLAEAAGYEGVKNAVVMRTADGLVMDVQDYLRKRIYKVISTADGVRVQEIEAKERGMCGCDTLKPPHSAGAKASASVVQAGAAGAAGSSGEAGASWAAASGAPAEPGAAPSNLSTIAFARGCSLRFSRVYARERR